MIQTYREEFEALHNVFRAGWNDTTPIAWENISYQPQQGVPWVRFTVLPAKSAQASIGAPGQNYFRFPGVIDVQIFTPKYGGALSGIDLADKVIEIFHDLDLDGFHFEPGYKTTLPSSHDEGWHQTNVTIRYRRDAIK